MCAEEPVVDGGLSRRLSRAFLAAQELLTIQLGLDLGLYGTLNDLGPVTPSAVAAASGTDPRYVREWLEQQAVAGVIKVVDDHAGPADRTYALPPENAATLLSEENLDYLAPLATLAEALAHTLSEVANAFRTGAGVPPESYGAQMRHAASRLNRPLFANLLADRWLAAVPELEERLRDGVVARIADVGCGAGWSSVALALAYPTVTVHGLDIDQPSVSQARRHAEERGLDSRVMFFVGDVAVPPLEGRYDLVTCFEALHDMPRPVEALRGMRGLLADEGTLLVAEECVQESFVAPGDERERGVYCWSVLHCLPIGRSDRPSAATGAVLRPSILAEHAREAGFSEVSVVPLDDPIWRFFLLRR